jgi:hypothetical protein
MSARVIDEPLAIEFAFSDATRFTLLLCHLPCPRLVADLAVGLAGLAHPNGTVDSTATTRHYRTALGQLARFLDAAGFFRRRCRPESRSTGWSSGWEPAQRRSV